MRSKMVNFKWTKIQILCVVPVKSWRRRGGRRTDTALERLGAGPKRRGQSLRGQEVNCPACRRDRGTDDTLCDTTHLLTLTLNHRQLFHAVQLLGLNRLHINKQKIKNYAIGLNSTIYIKKIPISVNCIIRSFISWANTNALSPLEQRLACKKFCSNNSWKFTVCGPTLTWSKPIKQKWKTILIVVAVAIVEISWALAALGITKSRNT